MSQSHDFDILKLLLITSGARCTDLHWIPWFCIISTARLQQCHWANRCLCTQHLMWICGYKTHYSLQYRPLNTLPCPMQHFTIIFLGVFFEVQLITSAARCTDLHWIPLFCFISTARLQQCHWANRCLCTQHLMRIYGYKAHHSLQYRPENALPCPMQQFTINTFGFFQITAHPICSQVHWLALSPMFLYQFHSATGLALSLHTASDVDLCKGCNTDLCTPSQAGCSNSRSIRFYVFPKYSSSHLQLGTLTCIESHDCVSFPQLDCNITTDLAVVSTHNI